MAQSIFGGATSYEEQSLNDICEDIGRWINYTHKIKDEITNNLEKAKQSGYWSKVPFDFQQTVLSALMYYNTIVSDLTMVQYAINSGCVLQREVDLLRKIGVKAIEYNTSEYPYSWNCDNREGWKEYNNPDFKVIEDMYAQGRDYFVSLQDATNAASRLEDYMSDSKQIYNNISIGGNANNLQIQQGTVNSNQIYEKNEFDYESALAMLKQIQAYSTNELFEKEFGETADEIKALVNDAIAKAEEKKDSKHIKDALTKIGSFAGAVSSGIIANGIFMLIQRGIALL